MAAQAALDTVAPDVIVVTGSNAEGVTAALSGMPRVRTCFNPEWKSGISSSLVAGLGSLDNDVDGLLVTLADQPQVTSELLSKLLTAFRDGHRLAAAEYNGVIGVPAVFGQELFGELAGLTGDSGAGAWLRARSKKVKTVPMKTAALDIDTPSDLALLRSIPAS